MKSLEYYTSERFIHDDLVKEVESALETIPEGWRQKGSIDSFILSWPSEPVPDDDGVPITGSILCALPEGKSERMKEISGLVQKTNPFGLLLCEQIEGEVRLIFETSHGSKSWHFPIEKHGPDRVLGRMTERTDEVRLGILFTRQLVG